MNYENINYSRYWKSVFHPKLVEVEEVWTFPAEVLRRLEFTEVTPGLHIRRAVKNCSLALTLG